MGVVWVTIQSPEWTHLDQWIPEFGVVLSSCKISLKSAVLVLYRNAQNATMTVQKVLISHHNLPKGSSLDIAPLKILDSGALQPRKWQLTVVPWRKLVTAHSPCWRTVGPTVCSQQAYYAKSTMLGLHPVIHVPNYMNHYSIIDPLRDVWLSWPCWLTDSGGLNHKVGTHPASSLAHDRESLSAETGVLTTMLRCQTTFFVKILQ